jgi:hypothetical protein
MGTLLKIIADVLRKMIGRVSVEFSVKISFN